MRSLIWALGLSGTAAAAAVSTTVANDHHATTTAPQPHSTEDTPCAIAKSRAEAFMSAEPEATRAFVLPSIAYNCLKSIPVDKENDMGLLNYLEPYVQFQSTLEPLAAPPDFYLIPGVDVLSGFGQIRAKLTNDEYDSQVDFALELSYLFIQASDGHFVYKPAILDVFQFGSLSSVVSVADNATALPRVYLRSDFEQYVANDTDVYDIESIDGVPIVEFLEAQAWRALSQDPDAQYNSLFVNPAQLAMGSGDGFSPRFPGQSPDVQVIKFTNGTTFNDTLVASISVKAVDYIGSAGVIHEYFELPVTATPTSSSSLSSTASSTSSATPTSTQLRGYPVPVVKHAHDWISGYFMNGSEYEDIAVLSIPAFSPWTIPETKINGTFETLEAESVVSEFLQKAKDAGKTKLIIDMQANPGGLIFAGYQLYNQLFPRADIWDGNRLRAHAALDALGTTAEKVAPEILSDAVTSVYNENHEAYDSWADLYGPQFIGEQNVTHLLRYNLSEEFDFSTQEQVFDAENIVVVTDGQCASTCTIFTGLLVREQGVRSITLGGRPMESAMQVIGGVEGAQVLNFINLQQFVAQVGLNASQSNFTEYLEAAFDVLPSIEEPPLLPALAEAGSFNYRNAYARGDFNGYPEQFKYEASNCRLFYTAEMIVDPVAIWNTTAQTAWGGGQCVNGSTANVNNTISSDVVGFDKKVLSTVKAYDGPGSLSFKGDYEGPQPYTQKSSKRSIMDHLTPAEDFVYEVKPKMASV
ncbi:Peptidase S41 family protein ustP [Colletotrichum fructicola]|nr:Peptidase S41 family protein ustP [Colletotrichum fructicola]KAF4923756.1 Peptidase S41 family protein ustP [Colletotrichum fructicola]KAF5485870.1 Peptidase S41 family protein ustP [Colletotrichum fructicola]